MELLKTKDAATVILFDLRLSEGELQYFAIALDYLLKNLDDKQLHALFTEPQYQQQIDPSETRGFAEETVRELVTMIRKHCEPRLLPSRFRGQGPF